MKNHNHKRRFLTTLFFLLSRLKFSYPSPSFFYLYSLPVNISFPLPLPFFHLRFFYLYSLSVNLTSSLPIISPSILCNIMLIFLLRFFFLSLKYFFVNFFLKNIKLMNSEFVGNNYFLSKLRVYFHIGEEQPDTLISPSCVFLTFVLPRAYFF